MQMKCPECPVCGEKSFEKSCPQCGCDNFRDNVQYLTIAKLASEDQLARSLAMTQAECNMLRETVRKQEKKIEEIQGTITTLLQTVAKLQETDEKPQDNPDELENASKKSEKVSAPEILDVQVPADQSIRAGSIVSFGCYETEPIQWIVLTRTRDKALLASKYVLDVHRFDANQYQGWRNSEIRKWLNHDFLQTAFDKWEQKRISATNIVTSANAFNDGGVPSLDNIWLLSISDVKNYLPQLRACYEKSKSGVKQPIENDYDTMNEAKDNTGGWWWLRSPGRNYYSASTCMDDCTFSDMMVRNEAGGVRPALWLMLNEQ